ncbi:glycerophosphodiester phosphodiesterase [Roseomonas sp. KE2513]|uniref:glycerophosphodiester phosphodiesterase family protein n=1 Tax=Roseomonas sp. KE2513 TaxID=2479202 RepID=UPI0018DFB913|nr:glycerophosphodiester phosphodiesterase family protein [Roseomonas sp. KE2513]MBI0537243.1 glycerophosphodiester phosphodiesterase [Roseomonas sp. KE2513]
MGKRIIGHRGARDLWPENGLLGFREVLGLGVAGVEFDVHPTADGDLAVIHDPTLDRTTDAQGPVAARTMEELRALRLKGGEEGVPSLDEVLDVLAPSGTELHIELKVDHAGRPYPGLEVRVAEHVRRRGLSARTVLTSFWPEVLHRLRATCPEGRLLASVNASSAEKLGGLDAVLNELDEARVDYVAVHHVLLSRELDRLLHRVGTPRLGVWVVNEPAEIVRWLAAPVTLITTDRPDLFQRQD